MPITWRLLPWAELLLVSIAAVLAWWPNRFTPAVFVVLGLGWVVRRWHTGRWSVATPFDIPVVVVLASLPIVLLQLSGGPPLPLHAGPAAGDGGPVVLRRGMNVGPGAYEFLDAARGTLSIWVRPTGWSGGDGQWHTIIADEIGGPLLHKDVDNRLYFEAPRIGEIVAAPVTDESLTGEVWHNIALVWDEAHPVDGHNYAVVYLDGEPLGARAQPFLGEAWGNLVIGSSSEPTYVRDFDFTGLGLWDRALLPEEVGRLERAGPEQGAAGAIDPSIRIVQAPGTSVFLTLPRTAQPGPSSTFGETENQHVALAPASPGACDAASTSTSIAGLTAGHWYVLTYPSGGTFASTLFQSPGHVASARLPDTCGVLPAGGDPLSLEGDVMEMEPITASWAADLWSTPGHGHGGEDRRVWGLALGIGVAYTFANTPGRRVLRWYLPGVVAVGMLVAVSALFATDWDLVDKVLGLSSIQRALPQLRVRLVENSQNGLINPNELGGLLACLVPLSAALALTAPRYWRIAAGASLVLAAGVLVLTQSRSGMLAAGCGLLVVLLARYGRLRTIAPLLVGLCLAVVLLTIARSGAAIASLVGARADVWARAWAIFSEHALTGIGLGRFDLAYAAYFASLAEPEPLVPHAHNLLLQAMLDLGLVGGLAYGAVFVLALVACLRLIRTADPRLRIAAAGLGGSALAAVVFGLTDTIAPGARAGLFYWVVFGLIASLVAYDRDLRGRINRGPPWRTDASRNAIRERETPAVAEHGSTTL